jgi:membrane associated rhomboid family serine protease
MGIWEDIKNPFHKGNNLIRLIYINIAVFLIISIFSIVGYLLNNQQISEKVLNILAVPASFKTLLVRPWTIITYMFTHKNIWHILLNMLWLYWFGRIFLEYLDQRKLVAVYLLGGISGAVLYVLSFNIFPVFRDVVLVSVAIGASASVMAVVIAIAAYVPNYAVQFFLIGRIRIIYVALAIFVVTSFLDFSSNSGGKLAHIGGALFGFLFTLNIKKGRDIGKGINSIIDFFATLFKPRRKMKVTYKKTASDYDYKKTDYDYKKTKAEHQVKINQILDKISKGGYDSLTKEEKDTLFKESQKKN